MRRAHHYEMDMCSGSLLPKILRFTFPLVLTGVLQLLYNAADVVVVGQFVGPQALAAVGSTGALINLIINVFMGLGVGASVVIARAYGAGDAKAVHQGVHTAMVVAGIGGVIMAVLGYVLARPLLLLMVTCGLRRGEALGLTWAAVDWTAGTIAICQQRGRVAGRGMQTAALKTGASARVLPLAGPVARELTAWRAAQPVLTRWVLDTTPERLARDHAAALAAAGLPHVTLHGLRHSMATAAAEAGAPIKLLQAVLGHSTYKLTADLYADHVRAAALGPVLDTMARVMEV